MDDLISRQTAIDKFVKLGDYYDGRDEVKRGIHQCIAATYDLPSAQPDLNEWCMDCKEYDKERHLCPRFNRVIRETLKDASERKTGAWSVYDRHTIPYQYICSECGAYHRAMYDFCPSCGADMRENK